MPDGPDPPKIDPSSPYYLSPHDRPNDSITSVCLKLDNYDSWAHDVSIALRSRRKFGFLNGTLTSPVAPCSKDDWDTIHCMLVSWLMRSIDPEVKSLLPKYDNAQRLWDDLRERFSITNGPRIYQIKSDLHDCKQTELMTVAVYYGKLSMLWDDLDKHEPIISCKCDCDVGKQHLARRDADRLHQFLLGLLSSQYGTLRSVLLAQDPLPNLNRAFLAISQEERVRGMEPLNKVTVPVAGFAVHSSPQQLVPQLTQYISKAEKRKLVCSHCKRSGHDISMCFELIDEVPDWWYNLKGKKPPPAGRGRGGRAGISPTVRTNVIGAPSSDTPTVGQVTVYGSSSHAQAGPTLEDGDWHR